MGQLTRVASVTPTKFQTRTVRVTRESTSTLHPDGSVTLDRSTESTELEGFIHWGSGVFSSGTVGAVAVPGQVADPSFFAPEAGAVLPAEDAAP